MAHHPGDEAPRIRGNLIDVAKRVGEIQRRFADHRYRYVSESWVLREYGVGKPRPCAGRIHRQRRFAANAFDPKRTFFNRLFIVCKEGAGRMARWWYAESLVGQ